MQENEPQKPPNPKNMLRKFAASYAGAAIFKNADFALSPLEIENFIEF